MPSVLMSRRRKKKFGISYIELLFRADIPRIVQEITPMPGIKQRWTVHFTGRVQGVGSRASTEHLAAGFAVTGYVRNLPDGRVELVAEGTDDELRALVREIQARLGQYIRQQTQTSDAASGEWDEFSIRY